MPQKADKPKPKDLIIPIYALDERETPFPWSDPRHCRKPLGKDKMWCYTLQCGLYETSELGTLLEHKIGPHVEVFEDRRDGGRSRLFDLSFEDNGCPIPDSFTLSLACWSAGQILHFDNGIEILEQGGQIDVHGLQNADEDILSPNSGYSGFDELSQRLVQWLTIEKAGMREPGRQPNREWLDGFMDLVASKCFLTDGIIGPACVAKCFQVKKKDPQTDKKEQQTDKENRATDKEKRQTDEEKVARRDDLLNSFFIGDLKAITSAWKTHNIGKGFSDYITAVGSIESYRMDLRTSCGIDAAYQALTPERMPLGCWPSNHPLVFSQQLAVNEIWRRLSKGSGIFAVNGPPGTGKTTLLRDIVAAVVTDRATRLVAAGPSAFKPKATHKLGDIRVRYFSFVEAVAGKAVVVASANNGAVENVSLELPGVGAVPEDVVERSDYFSRLAERVTGKPAWGLLSARLGNKANRNKFLSRFWWQEPKEPKIKESKRHGRLLPEDREEGLRYHLNLIQQGEREPAISWNDAVKRFKEAQDKAISICERLRAVSKVPMRVAVLQKDIMENADAISLAESAIEKQRRECACFFAEADRLSKENVKLHDLLKEVQQILQSHDDAKPGLLFWLSTMGRSHKEWWARRRIIVAEMDDIRQKCTDLEKTLCKTNAGYKDAQDKLLVLDRSLMRAQDSLDKLKSEMLALESDLKDARSSLGVCWPEQGADDKSREKSSPWATKEWRKARNEVFLAALDVHRAFIENHPAEMLANIGLAGYWLNGKAMPETLARTALDALCVVVPVISTTFASIPRMLKYIGREGIGWLLIDEAGQAMPQQAAGAIWRAMRTVVVGDPKQLEPVMAVPATVEGAFANYYGVDQAWWPSETSAQHLADQVMDIGTWLSDTEKGKLWVGCPLRVHRRCDDPMFSISNKVAYDGLMVHGKSYSASVLPECHWIDVRSEDGEGNWVPAESIAVRDLLLCLQGRYGLGKSDIFLISPFRDCASKLKDMARSLGLDPNKTGTIHTTQGKEADVVVLVLGGNPKRPGARAWAAKKPNLLNVAVSRAKQRLYVVGNMDGWRNHGHFRVLVEQLPVAHATPEPSLLVV